MDQDSKQVAREAIYIRINNPVLKCNIGKMYIPEISNSLLGADMPSDWSLQMADPYLPHPIIQINKLFRAVCLAK